MRLGAMPGVRDGHTGIFPLNPANRRLLHAYPIRMYTFADGTYVVGQAGGSDLLRARVVAVGGHPIEDVIAAVSPLVPHDNDSTLMLRVTTYLNTPEVLHGLGLVPDLGPGDVHVRARRQQVRRQLDSAHRSGVRPRNRRSGASAAAAGNHRRRTCVRRPSQPADLDDHARRQACLLHRLQRDARVDGCRRSPDVQGGEGEAAARRHRRPAEQRRR